MPLITRYQTNGAKCDKSKCGATVSWDWIDANTKAKVKDGAVISENVAVAEAVAAAGWSMWLAGPRRYLYCPDHFPESGPITRVRLA